MSLYTKDMMAVLEPANIHIYRISLIRRHGYYFFHCLFSAATTWGQHLFHW